ncbi:hypothetical protein GW796_08075 [archaeon]|nr:hypothetical protein [archaeon]
MTKRKRFEAALDKRDALKNAEEANLVADSIEVRLELMTRVNNGEITLEDAQKELKKIKGKAKNNGKLTRAQAYSRG